MLTEAAFTSMSKSYKKFDLCTGTISFNSLNLSFKLTFRHLMWETIRNKRKPGLKEKKERRQLKYIWLSVSVSTFYHLAEFMIYILK